MKGMENVTGLQHIGIPSSDLEHSVAFYEGLGFTVTGHFPNGEHQVYFMEYGGLVLELYHGEPVAGAPGAINHLALNVTRDIEAVYAALVEQHYTLVTDHVMELPFWEHGIKYCIIQAPDGVLVEFCQIL